MTQNVALGNQAEFQPVRHQSRVVEDEKRRDHLYQRLELLSVIALATIYLIWFAWPLFWAASENVRLVSTFNTDEEAHVILIREAIDNRFPRLGYIQYGYAYLNMGLLPLFILSYFIEVTDQQIIVWLRMIPALFSIAIITLTFLMTRRYFSRVAAWLAVFLLSFTALNFLEMSAMSHSDIPQLFFLMLSIYFCCRLAEDGRLKWLIWASISAGFAFGCKYTGLFLLPVIGFYGILSTIQMEPAQAKVDSDRVIKVSRILAMLMGAVLLIVGFVIIPYAAAPYAGAEYFGVSIPELFATLRFMAITGGIGLILLAVIPFVWAFIRPRPKLAYLLKLGLLAAIAFAGAFFISSPFNVFNVRAGFVRGFLYESLHSSFGHEFAEPSNPLLWVNFLVSPQLLDPFILGLAGLSLVLTVHQVVKKGWRRLLEPDSVLWVWGLFYLSFLLGRVNIRTHRALLPVIPFLLILAAYAVSQVLQYASVRLSRRLAVGLTMVTLLIIVGLQLPKSVERIVAFRHATGEREQTSTAVAAGHWLAEQYPSFSRILYDPFSYVPPSFTNVYVTPWGGTLQLLQEIKPEVVVTNSYNSGLFSDIHQAATFSRDEAIFMEKYEYYEVLREETAGYELVRDFGDVQIYTKSRN